MILEIDDAKTIADLQDRFSLCYPTLKLEFCRKKHGWQQVCSGNQIIHDDLPVAEIRNIHTPGTIEIKSWHKVGEVEKEFYSKFGLSVQICYLSGDHWIQTGASDDITIDSLIQKTSPEAKRVLL